MDPTILKILTSLGLPTAIVALALLAWLFRKIQPWFTTVALILFLVLVAPLGAIELYQRLNPPDLDLKITPERWYAFNREGEPVDVHAEIVGARANIARDFHGENIFHDGLRLARNSEGSGYTIQFGNNTLLGPVSTSSIHSAGLVSADEVPSSNNSPFQPQKVWQTGRVYLQQSPVILGESTYGTLSLNVFGYHGDGTASVSLDFPAGGTFAPDTVKIANKGLDTQTLGGHEEFLILVREADFRGGASSWAAFTVIGR